MDNGNATLIPSVRGGQKLVFEGFTYRYQKALAGGEHRWKCDAPGAGAKCRGSARTKATEDGVIATVSTEHSHGPAPPASLEAARIRQALKEDVLANPTKSIQAATAHALQPASEFALARLPARDAIKRSVRKARCAKKRAKYENGEGAEAPCEDNLVDLIAPQPLLQSNNETFLLYDSGPRPDRIVIFSTQSNMKFLEKCDVWVSDGTFKVTPKLWYQTYTIHAYMLGHTVPVAYAMLPNKHKSTYIEMWSAIKVATNRDRPPMLLTDFEQASFLAAEEVFEGIETRGCYFHLGQSIERNVAALGLKRKYQEDQEFKLRVKMLSALAFLPPDRAEEAFCTMEPAFQDDEVPALSYFENA